MLLVSAVVFMILMVLLINSQRLKEKRAEYEKKHEYLLEQIEDENRRTEEIEEYRKYMHTLEYIEKMAKEKLGLVHKDEIIIEAED
jgi:cell division protein DivIC